MNNDFWNNKIIQETIKRMNPQERYKFQKMYEVLYDKAISDPQTINMDVATQVKLMLRDGLHPDLLDENEREIYINTFGEDSLKQFYVTDEQLSQKLIHKKSKKTKNSSPNKHLSPKRLEF